LRAKERDKAKGKEERDKAKGKEAKGRGERE